MEFQKLAMEVQKMLTAEDNEMLCRVGPGTPMGQFMREYWIPGMLSSELPHPDCDPVRVKLLGEELVAFRDTDGKVGLIQNACLHRRASLYFGRNEGCGLRCLYHGWKYDRSGSVVDMPNEPDKTRFREGLRATAYPCVERAGFIWSYMGPRSTPPPLPEVPANLLPDGEWAASAISKEYNWLQGLEGDIDTTHVGFLHWAHLRADDYPPDSVTHHVLAHRSPRFELQDTDYGLLFAAKRPAGEDQSLWRFTQFFYPFATHTGGLQYKAYVPMDDTHTLAIRTALKSEEHGFTDYLPDTDDWYGRFVPASNAQNSYHLDRELQRTGKNSTGMPGGATVEDQAMCESMGPIVDRSEEHLVSSDVAVVRVRQLLLAAVKNFQAGASAPAVDSPELYREMTAGYITTPCGSQMMEAVAAMKLEPPETWSWLGPSRPVRAS